MKVVVLLVIVVFSTFVQSYKIRIIRRRYKHKTNRTAVVDEQGTVPVYQEPRLDNSVHTYPYKRRYKDQEPDETAIKVIPGPRINRVVANLCKDSNKDILVVWETVARVLGLDKGYPIQHRGELRKLTTIIRTFVTLSKENDFEQMPVHQILQTIDYNLGQATHRNDIAEAISQPYFGIPALGSSIPGNEETYFEPLETDRIGYNAESLSTEPISAPSLKTPNLKSNENILKSTNSVNLEDVETGLPLEPAIDSNLIGSINTGRLVEFENGYKIIPATPSFLDSDELITVISPGENAYDDISTEIPLGKETNILTTASSLNPEELITLNRLQPIDSVHDSLEPIHGDDVLEIRQSAEDTSDDAFTGNTRRSFGALLDQLIMNLIQSSNVTLRKDGHDAIHEDTNLYLDPDNIIPDHVNSHDSAENGVSSEVGKIIPFDSTDLDEDISSLRSANSKTASLQTNNIDAINSQIDGNNLDIDTNTLVTSSYSSLENPVELTPIANNSNVYLVFDSPLYHHENITSEKHLDPRRLLKIEDEFTISPVALHPDVINSPASTDHTLFRSPDYIQKPFKQITPYDVKTSQMHLDPVEHGDDKPRISIDPIDISQNNPKIMTPYVVDPSQRNSNPTVSEDDDARKINLNLIASYDEDNGVNKIYPFNPNHVKTNQINLDPTVPYDPIDSNTLYNDNTNLRNRVDSYDFHTSQINPAVMAPYVVDTSQKNPNPAVSEDVDIGQPNVDTVITYDEDTSVRNLGPIDPNDVESNQITLGPNVLYDDVDNNLKNLDPTLPYDLINSNAPYDIDTHLKNQVNSYDFDTSQINPDIMAPYLVDTSQRNANPVVSENVDAGQTNVDSIISYDEDTSVRNFDPVDPIDVETNQISLGPSVLYDDVDKNYKYLDPSLPSGLINPNTNIDTNLKNQVNNYDFDTSQIDPDIMAPYVVDTSQRNPNPAVSDDVNAEQRNQDSVISYIKVTSARNFDPVDRIDVETNQINHGPSVLYEDVDTSHKNLDPTPRYNPIDRNASYGVDTNLGNRVDNYDFETSQTNPDIMAPYVVNTSQRNANTVVSEDVDAGQTNLDSIISYDEDTSVRNVDSVDPIDLETNQISLGPSVLYDDVDTNHKNLYPTVSYDPIDRNAPYDVDSNLRNLVDDYDFDISQINPDIMAPYVVDTSQKYPNPAVSEDVDVGQPNIDTVITYDEDTSVRTLGPNDVETTQITLGPNVLYDDDDKNLKNLDPTLPYDLINSNAPYDIDTHLKNQVNSYDFATSQINPDIMAPYLVDTSQRNANPVVSGNVDAGQTNLDSIISYDEDTSVRNFDLIDPSDIKTNKINLDRSSLYDDVNISQNNLDPTVPYDQIDPTVAFDFDANHTNIDLTVPYAVDINHRNLDPVGPDEVESSRVNLDTIASYGVAKSQENLDPTVHYDVDTTQRNIDPTVPYNVYISQKNIDSVDTYDGQKKLINLGTIVSQDTDPSQRNDYPIMSHDSARRKILHLIMPYDVKVQQSSRNLGPVVRYNIGTGRTNLDPIAHVIDTKQRNLNLIAPYKVGATQASPQPIIYHRDTSQRYYDSAVPYDVKISQKNLDRKTPYFVEARQWNPHKIDANQITRQRNLETNRINLELVDPYEFDTRTNPYSSETYDFDVSRKHTNSHYNIRSQKNLDPIFLYNKHTNFKKKDPQFSFNNRYNLSPEDNVDVIVFSILPEILSRYSDCKNKARSVIINKLKEIVIALENNRCHRSP